jgi:NAD-dependent dihydropyrimidine dehydrogenase PreA subunit
MLPVLRGVIGMIYAERFPNFAKIENPAIRAIWYSYAHLWTYMKSGKWPLDPNEMPPHVAYLFKYMGESSGNPNERMFIYPVGQSRPVFRDPATGKETPVDPWAGIYDYVDTASYICESKYDYCRESGSGDFEHGKSCYCDKLRCANFLGEAARNGIPESQFEMTRSEFKKKLEYTREHGEHFMDFGYGPPDTCVHAMFPTTGVLTIGFCPYSTTVPGWTTLWDPVCKATGVNNSLFYAEIDQDKCSGCGRCKPVCIVNKIDFDPLSKRAYIIDDFCMGCGRCHVACPEGAIKLLAKHKDTAAFVHHELDCRITVNDKPPVFDPEIWPTLVHGGPEALKWYEEHWDVDKMYQDWLAAHTANSDL